MTAEATAVASRLASLEEAGRRLRERPTDEVVAAIARACGRWRDPADPHRREGEEALGAHYQVPRMAVAEILDTAFEAWTEEALGDWIAGELGHRGALDGFVRLGSARRMACGPRLMVVLAARGVPTTPVADGIAALCVKAPVWLKPATGADDLAARFAVTAAECDPGLGEAIEVAAWPSASEEGGAVIAAADVLVATGRAETIAALRDVVPPDTRLVVHGPRLSAAILTRSSIADDRQGIIAALARDTAFAGQMGCLSPSVAYVEGPPHEAADLVRSVQAACTERWPCPTRREEGAAERAAFAEWAALAGVEAAAGIGGAWEGGIEAAWSVQARLLAEPPAPAAVPRLLVLAPIVDAGEVPALCARKRGMIASVGIAGPPKQAAALAPPLAAAGVERVTPLGRMQSPPPAWRRDGRATLADLVRWIDWED